jgi:L-erythro-3,5-diaminohexanoate dehydrogenase
VLPQAAQRLDASAEIAPYEARVRVERLNLDAASFRQLWVAQGATGTRSEPRTPSCSPARSSRSCPTTSRLSELALDLVRTDPGVRMLFDARPAAD